MSLGRRGSAPTNPPIPMPPPPPAAYGIAVPGMPAAPLPPQYAPPAASPMPAYAAPPAPAAAPSDASGFFGGPVPHAPPPTFGGPSQFGAPAAPTQFGTPGGQFGGPPTIPYGAPPWASAPANRSGSRLWAKIVGGLIATLVVGGVGLHLYDAATAHHVGTLPVALQDATRDDSPQAQSIIAESVARAKADNDMSKLKHLQVGIYRSGATVLVAEIGDIPSNSAAFRDELLNSAGGGAGMPVSSVSAGRQGGSESCGGTASSEMCVWVDNGTIGLMFVVNSADQATAEAYLQALRDVTER